MSLAVVVAVAASVSVAQAQPPIGSRFATPSAWAEAEASAGSLATETLQGGAGTLRVRGSWAPLPFFEVGAAILASAHHLDSIERQHAHGRAGLAWGRLSLGSGGLITLDEDTGQAIALGFRGHAAAAPRELGLGDLDAGARSLGLGGELAIGLVSDHLCTHAVYDLTRYRGDDGWSTVLEHHLGGALVGFLGRFHPILDVELRVAFGTIPTSGIAARLHLGTLIDLARRARVRITLDLGVPGDAEGFLAGVTVGLLLWPRPEHPGPGA